MTINIEQEILDWYNDSEQEDFVKEEEYNGDVWDAFYESIAWGDKTPLLASGKVKLEEDHGGGEGDGEERFVVFSVNGQYFEVVGYYASWDGTTWDDLTIYEVEPVQVQVTKFKRKR